MEHLISTSETRTEDLKQTNTLMEEQLNQLKSEVSHESNESVEMYKKEIDELKLMLSKYTCGADSLHKKLDQVQRINCELQVSHYLF